MSTAITAVPANPYLDDFLAPVSAEVTATDLPVTGHIPDFLDGRYLRNGPNPVARRRPRHLSLVHRRRHGARRRACRAARPAGTATAGFAARGVRAALGEPAATARNLHAGMQAFGANTNVLGHAGKTLALVEGGVRQLRTHRRTRHRRRRATSTAPSPAATPRTRIATRRTGELHAVSYSFARGNTVQYSVIDTTVAPVAPSTSTWCGSPMMHDFSLTEQIRGALRPAGDPRPDAGGCRRTVPRWMRLPARLVLAIVVGRVRCPGRSRR